MALPHLCVALMAALAATALLLTLDAPVTLASAQNSSVAMEGRVSQRRPYSVKAISFALSEGEQLNTLKVLQAFAAAMPSLGWSGDDFCSWRDIACIDANVSIIVTRLPLPGTLPEMPKDVDYSMVRLDEINLFGGEKSVFGTLPHSWGKLMKVRTINLAYTGISGTLPLSWSSMSSLRSLSLSFTDVSGTLPASWASMAVVRQIRLSSTQISGTLPESWSAMPSLRQLSLDECHLYGSLPESWALMPSLQRLDLQNNNFCGCVPASWLTSPTLVMGVERRHRMGNCSTAQPRVETSGPDPVIRSSSTSMTAERDRHSTTTTTTMPPKSKRTTEPPSLLDHQCKAPNCTLCAADEGVRCSTCADGYVLTDEGQCMQNSSSIGAELFGMTEAERVNTLRVLQAFAAALPSLGWSGDNFCSWSGVTCVGGNVSVILALYEVTGTLPEVPDDVDYSTVRLDHISIFGQDSGITGTLPSSWGMLRRVQKISLGYMSINGTLPVSWASMRSLSVLRLRSVSVSGTLPAAWSSMEAMEEIMMFKTEITGTLPEAWSTMPKLARIDLERCKLYGSLPESWARMPSLGHLSLRNNDLCGCVPEKWLTSPTLVLSVDTKHLLKNCKTEEGCVEVTTTRPGAQYDPRCQVPHCISCLPRDWKLCGVCIDGYVLTDDWQCMKGPEWEAAPLAMTEAEWWNTLKVLHAFAAAMPSLGWSGGDFCSWSGVTCSDDSVSIFLARSGVVGTLPEMPDDVDYSMVRLNEISIFRQQGGLTGTLPRSWCKLRKMRVINLGYTGIVGTLPGAWSSMTSLRSLRLGFTRVFGTLPAEWRAMRAVEEIVLSTTEISGTLPEAWSIMPSLRKVNLEDNKLYGSLPESWARMPSLDRVSLHDNYFCGCVPERWVRSATLSVSVDAKHWAEDCATADACVEKATPDPVPSSSSIIRTAEATRLTTTTSNIPYSTPPSTRAETRRTTTRAPAVTPAAPAASECKVPNCMTCATGDSTRCSRCLLGYLSTAGWECQISATADASVMPPGTTPTAAICVAVVVMSAMLA